MFQNFMLINADKPHLWKQDSIASVDQYNNWFINFAPVEYRKQRGQTTEHVETALLQSDDFNDLTPAILKQHPSILQTLRMATAPPLARDRLIGLAGVTKSLVESLEAGRLPSRMAVPERDRQLAKLSDVLEELLDRGIFPWLDETRAATEEERLRASMIVADRLCGARTDPIIRNAQEARQLDLLAAFFSELGYEKRNPPAGQLTTSMAAGTFSFRLIVLGTRGDGSNVNIPVDAVVQPKKPRPGGLPILIEAKSAGDFTNTNKRRKEEATKLHQLRATHGPDTSLLLFLCGYFDAGYLGYEASEGLDWVWEHRINDLLQLGL